MNESWLAVGWNSTAAYLINMRLPELATGWLKECKAACLNERKVE
jgi:hypothetical protein